MLTLACLQMVDRLDAGLLPIEIAPGDYGGLYQVSLCGPRVHVIWPWSKRGPILV